MDLHVLHWMRESWYLNDRCSSEVIDERLLVDGRRHEDHFDGLVPFEKFAQFQQKEVAVYAPLMDLLDA